MGHGQVMGTLQMGQNLQEDYGHVTGRLWAAYEYVTDLTGRLQVGHGYVTGRALMGGSQTLQASYRQVTSGLQAYHRQVISILLADHGKAYFEGD